MSNLEVRSSDARQSLPGDRKVRRTKRPKRIQRMVELSPQCRRRRRRGHLRSLVQRLLRRRPLGRPPSGRPMANANQRPRLRKRTSLTLNPPCQMRRVIFRGPQTGLLCVSFWDFSYPYIFLYRIVIHLMTLSISIVSIPDRLTYASFYDYAIPLSRFVAILIRRRAIV